MKLEGSLYVTLIKEVLIKIVRSSSLPALSFAVGLALFISIPRSRNASKISFGFRRGRGCIDTGFVKL